MARQKSARRMRSGVKTGKRKRSIRSRVRPAIRRKRIGRKGVSKGSLLLRRRKRRLVGARRVRGAAGADYQQAYNKAFDQGYNEGFGSGFAKGLQEGR